MGPYNLSFRFRCLECDSEYCVDMEPPYLYEQHPKMKEKDLYNEREYLVCLIINEEVGLRGEKCKFCGSSESCISHVNVNGKNLYNTLELNKRNWKNGQFFFTIEIIKENGNLLLTTGGNDTIPYLYLHEALHRITKEINRRVDKYFKSKESGYFFMALSGDFKKCRPERFIAYNIEKAELTDLIIQWQSEADSI